MTEFPEIRCPKLGHPVSLAYCYRMPEGHPCARLFGCWDGVLPNLRKVVAKLLTDEEWDRYFGTPPPSKLDTLVALIDHARDSAVTRGRHRKKR
jgi:hypothetical protein